MKHTNLSITQWISNLSHPVASLGEWIEIVQKLLEDSARKGCDILMIPEYASEHWMSFAPPGLKVTEELDWCATQAKKVVPELQALVKKTGVALVAGSLPWFESAKKGDSPPRIVNRAFMLFPDRKAVYHDKLVLIPSEQDPKGWDVCTGKAVRVFKWRGVRMTMLICLDIEMPALSSLLAKADVDLVLVPSFTEKKAGYHRVFGCAKARAVELMAAIAVVGCVGGSIRKGKRRTECYSGASIYIPCEEQFGHDGVHAEIAVHAAPKKGIGKVLYAMDVPLGRIRATRKGKPEVWPGAWSAKAVRLVEA